MDNKTKTLEIAKPVHDTGWTLASSSSIRRGIYDYMRIIQFAPDEDGYKIAQQIEWIQKHDNPGYYQWNVKRIGPNLIGLSTTVDSSD